MTIRALLREIPDSFASGALSAVPRDAESVRIDIALARVQHAAYRAALEAMGAEVTVLPADEGLPDCVFVEDTAVVIGSGVAGGSSGVAGVGGGGLALIARPGAPSRQGEIEAVAAVLGRHLSLARLDAPATLDGGDCMRLGQTLYIGRSARTNEAGIARAAELLAPHGVRIIAVDLPPGVLHLKCVCSPLGADRVLLAEASLPASLFAAEIVWVPREETYAANAVAIGDHVLAAAEYPRTLDALTASGLCVHPVPTSEVRKADGSLTCQSILY